MTRRLTALGAVLGLTFVGIVAGPAPGAAQDRPAGEEASARPVFEVADLAEAEAISLDDAAARLRQQDALPALAADARASLGDAFGGIWVDPDNDGRIKVGVVEGTVATGRAVVDRAADAQGVRDAVDVTAVRHSLAELDGASDWLGRRVVAIGETSDVALGVGMRPDQNAVVLHLPPDAQPPAEVTRLVAEAEARYGDMVRLARDATVGTARACAYPYCDPPLRAGVRIAGSSSLCTGSFLARSRSDHRLYQFTAGHCVLGGTSWSTQFADGSNHAIGPIHNARWDSGGDMAIIRVSNPAGWRARAWAQVTAGPDTTPDPAYRISRDAGSFVGQRICTTGGSYGRTDCGRVTELGLTTRYCSGDRCITVSGLGRASFCGTGGDSGAPVFAQGTAHGIHVAGFTACDSLYQGIGGAENAMNVDVSHEG